MADDAGEILAGLLLANLLPERFGGGFVLSDRPDLISMDGDVGIEVTSAMVDGEGEAMALLSKMMYQPVDSLLVRKVERMHDLGYDPLIYKGAVHGGLPRCASWVGDTEALAELKKKLSKLPGYSVHEHMELFIKTPYWGWYETDDEVVRFITSASEIMSGCELSFERIYLHPQNGMLWVCDMSARACKCITYSNDRYKRILSECGALYGIAHGKVFGACGE